MGGVKVSWGSSNRERWEPVHETQVLITTIDTHQATGKCDVCRKGQVVPFQGTVKNGKVCKYLDLLEFVIWVAVSEHSDQPHYSQLYTDGVHSTTSLYKLSS